ncbi:MAG TPA: peptidylprolyl isomerase [Nitrospiraceae bacterium]|nr:peptidylprolyl isomerase [Nitrospiraceae bacterium]
MATFAADEVKKGGEKPVNNNPIATIEMEKGNIVFEMFPDTAPKTVERISHLIESGFYNGLKFHRVVPGFVIQGGDPLGNGTGGSGVKLPAEFNNKPHVTGSVAMARAADPNSADSQFYICLAPQPSLDGKYTVFGQVTEGLEVIQKVRIGDVMKKVTLKK